MTELKIGDKAPDFNLPASNDETLSLSSMKGKKVVLYFYPKDDTPGCTTESCDFRNNLEQLNQLNVAVIGISKDSIERHKKFITKYDLNFPLVSDENNDTCENYGTWVEKNMYGRKYMGIQRATFLIDETGTIAHIWPKVKVKDHVDDVLKTIESL